MPKLNKLLVTSIIEDIRECGCVTNEIYSWLDKIEHLSWKFPTKTAKDINAMEIVKKHEGTAGEFYILLLELAYDRIQFALRLILEFMDKFHPFAQDLSVEAAFPNRRNQMSLASVIRLLWNQLKIIPDSTSHRLVKNRATEEGSERRFTRKVSRGSQVSCSLDYCESCSVAGRAILEMINAIEGAFIENNLISGAAVEREDLKDDIYGRTQWAVMSRLSIAIGRDVKAVLTTMRENNLKAQAAGRDYEERIRDLRADLSRREERIDTLQAKNSELEGALENVGAELEAARRNAISLERQNETLRETLGNMRKQIIQLAGGNSVLQSQMGTLAESKLELENTVSGLRKEVVESRDACLNTERHFQFLLEETDLNEVAALKRENSSTCTSKEAKKMEEKLKNIEEGDPNKGLQEETILMPKDDRELDMTLISDLERIEVLSRRNDRTSKTLSRLQEYQQTAQTIATNDGPSKPPADSRFSTLCHRES